jgi:hypothetical protein
VDSGTDIFEDLIEVLGLEVAHVETGVLKLSDETVIVHDVT